MAGYVSCVMISIIDDNAIESSEKFRVSLDNSEAVTVEENEITVTLEDNDGMLHYFIVEHCFKVRITFC